MKPIYECGRDDCPGTTGTAHLQEKCPIETSKVAPEHERTFIKPPWGLTHAIPEGVTLAWGARAIYSWRSVTKPVHTATGKIKISRGRKLTSTTYEPSIDLLWDRMGWSSFGALDAEGKTRVQTMGKWIDDTARPMLVTLCRAMGSRHPEMDGPEALVRFTDGEYTIVANPNGSHGYLYITAWRHVS
jgi:hypothetical protein